MPAPVALLDWWWCSMRWLATVTDESGLDGWFVSGYSGICFEIWCTTAWSGRPVMALCARVTKPGSGAYGTRHARVRPSVTHCVLAVRETVVMKPSRLNIMAQGISSSLPVPFLSPYTHLSLWGGLWPGCKQAGWQSPLREKREVTQQLHFTHTPSGKPASVALHYTCRTPEAVHWTSPWGRPQHQYVKGAQATS